MKKLLVILMCAVPMLFSQKASAQFSARVGYQAASFTTSSAGLQEFATDPMSGFVAALAFDYPIATNIYFTPALEYAYLTRGKNIGEISSKNGSIKVGASSDEHRISIPLRLKAKLPVSQLFTFVAYAGPVLSAGLVGQNLYSTNGNYKNIVGSGDFSYDYFSGKSKASNISDETASALIEGLGFPRQGRFEVLAGGGIGFEFAEIFTLTGGYDYGFLSRGKDGIDLKRSVWDISISMSF